MTLDIELDRGQSNISHWAARVDLAAAFQFAARLDLHEAVANHFSLSVSEDGSKEPLVDIDIARTNHREYHLR